MERFMMIQLFNNFQKLFLLLFMTLSSESIYAIDFEVNGITYYASSLTTTDVKVTGKTNNCTGRIVIPETVTYQGRQYTVVAIDEEAFYKKDDITSIVIPKTITYIYDDAFRGCDNLDAVYISSLDSWLNIRFGDSGSNPLTGANHLFVNGKEIHEIIIPDDVTVLDDYAFWGFLGLYKVIIPKTLKAIGMEFNNCRNLEVVISKNEKPSLIEIESDSYPFRGISPSAKLLVPRGTISSYLAIPKWRNNFYEIIEEGNDESNTISFADANVKAICIANWDTNGDGEISKEEAATVTDAGFGKAFRKSSINIFPEFKYFTGLTCIGNEAFEKCSNLNYIILPPNIKTLYSQAFKECGFTTFTIPEGIENIPSELLLGCPLNSISLPASIKEISSDYPFPRTITTITINKDNSYFECPSESNCIVYKESNTIVFGTNNSKIPSGVLHIGANAFQGATGLANVILPSSIITIDKEAFKNCSNLESVELPIGLTTIGESAFSGCTSLSKIQLPNTLTSIGTFAFETCSKIESITIPQNVSDWHGSSFIGCDGLLSVNVKCKIPIPYQVFAECGQLKSVVLTEGVNSIGSNAFIGCTSLVSIYLPRTIKSIGYATFQDCSSLESIVISDSITEIGLGAFKGCRSLARVESKLRKPFEVNGVFTNLPYNSELHVPYGTKAQYESVIGWNVFGEIIEAAPQQFNLDIAVIGNGSVTCKGKTIRNQSSSIVVTEGSTIAVGIYPDEGNRVLKVYVNGQDALAQIVGSELQFIMSEDMNIEVLFEEIPIITHTLTISVSGGGSVFFNGFAVRNQSRAFSVTEGSEATITFVLDNGYRIKSVKVDGVDVTGAVINSQYTVSNITKDVSMEVDFEEIPPAICTLSITSKGNGSVSYEGTSIRSKTSTFTLDAGTSATVSFVSDDGYRLMSAILNGTNITADVFNNQYTIVNITKDTALEIEFAEDVTDITHNGIDYKVVSYIDATLIVVGSDNGLTLSVPATISFKNRLWKVVGVEAGAFNDSPELAAIEWNPEVKFDGKVGNPNLLLYVKDKQYASEAIQNVVVNGEAEEIVLLETETCNNFYCPKAFMAKKVAYEHNYSMKSGYNTCQGWETIALPFDVTKIQRQGGTELLPYQAWTQGSVQRPFWLYSLTGLGWKAESSISANTPYIICMPNNEMYNSSYNITGIVRFIGENVQVKASANLAYGKDGNKKLIPNFQNQEASQEFYALNVNNLWSSNTDDNTIEGSVFVRGLRQVHPFEAYMTLDGDAARRFIHVFDDNATNILTESLLDDKGKHVIYNLNGQRVSSMSRGIYIQNGKIKVKR